MKSRFYLLLIPCSLFLASCTGKKDKIATYGDLDFDAIAADTTMQNTFEASYEYVKDYSFGNAQYSIAWGGFTGFENVLVIKRKDVTLQDTIAIVKCDSAYRLTESFIEDKNQDKTPEIRLVFSSKTDSTKKEKTVSFSQEKRNWNSK